MLLKILEPDFFIRKSTRKNKKYDIIKGDKYLLSFGSSHHHQYKDATPLKAYSHLDHNDKERRRRYYLRHSKTLNKNSPKYWSNRFLWK